MHLTRLFVALTVFCSVELAVAAPSLDTTFGASGIARIGAQSGREDTANVSTIQPDGKVLVAGLGSITRFTQSGMPDPTFGNSGSRPLVTPLAPLGLLATTSIHGDTLPVVFQFGALLLVLRGSRRGIAVAGLLCALAFLTKLSAVWAPIAIGI